MEPKCIPNKYQHRDVNTSTLAGLKQAETLKAQGWQIVAVGLWTISFTRINPKYQAWLDAQPKEA